MRLYLANNYQQLGIIIPDGEKGGQENPYIPTTEWKWQIDPYGFRDVMSKMYQVMIAARIPN